jgi:hypothetical protein
MIHKSYTPSVCFFISNYKEMYIILSQKKEEVNIA